MVQRYYVLLILLDTLPEAQITTVKGGFLARKESSTCNLARNVRKGTLPETAKTYSLRMQQNRIHDPECELLEVINEFLSNSQYVKLAR
jgi:hypothetical protein